MLLSIFRNYSNIWFLSLLIDYQIFDIVFFFEFLVHSSFHSFWLNFMIWFLIKSNDKNRFELITSIFSVNLISWSAFLLFKILACSDIQWICDVTLFIWFLIKFWWIWSINMCFEFSINLIDFWLSVKNHIFDENCIKLLTHSIAFSMTYISTSVMFISIFKFHDFDKILKFLYNTSDAAEIFDFSSCASLV